MATLAVYRGDQFLRHVELGETPTRIGRSPENELVLEDKGKGVSRSHAKILYEQGRYVIVDANSQNGVWIGNRKITRDVLPVDVPVTIGPYRLRLVPEPQASTGPLIPTEGEDRLIDPTELVGSGVQIPAAQAIPAQSSATQAKSAESSAAQAKPAQSSATHGKSAQSSAAHGKSAQSSTVQGKSAQSSAAQAKPAQSSPTHVTPARAGVESAPWPRKRVLVASVAVVGVVGLLATVLIIANARRSPAPVVALPSAPPVTPPSGPTVEQQFRDHYDKAQGYIEKGDKAAAATENAEALKLLPSDTRGLEQQTRVVAMIDPTTPPEPPPVETPADGGKTATGLIPPPPKPERSTLMVAPIAGETASQRSEREKRARDHLDDGKKALEERRYSTAVSLFQAAINSSQREDYGATKDEAKTLLKSARDAMAAAE